eukprot:Gb_13812 [translate_table: standard]
MGNLTVFSLTARAPHHQHSLMVNPIGLLVARTGDPVWLLQEAPLRGLESVEKVSGHLMPLSSFPPFPSARQAPSELQIKIP